MKAYVYFATVSGLFLAGCAFGTIAGQETEKKDAGFIVHADGGLKDSGHDAQQQQDVSTVEDVWQQPDVQQTQLCNPLPLGTGLAQCDTCLAASCCAEDTACGNDQDCLAFVSCLDGCFPTDGGPPDQQCANDCASLYPNGASELDSLDSCISSSCSLDCQ